MTRVPMFTPSALPQKAGLGTYMGPGIRRRYGEVEFSHFTGAEMIARKYGLDRRLLDILARAPARRTGTMPPKFRAISPI